MRSVLEHTESGEKNKYIYCPSQELLKKAIEVSQEDEVKNSLAVLTKDFVPLATEDKLEITKRLEHAKEDGFALRTRALLKANIAGSHGKSSEETMYLIAGLLSKPGNTDLKEKFASALVQNITKSF